MPITKGIAFIKNITIPKPQRYPASAFVINVNKQAVTTISGTKYITIDNAKYSHFSFLKVLYVLSIFLYKAVSSPDAYDFALYATFLATADKRVS